MEFTYTGKLKTLFFFRSCALVSS